ncbi:hypothetical protein HHK36_033254 [Tetracentron sinense]|uniref:Uncharacterized protein n=1 Tax=Tetracentron sinense TaxID=13715 RepID=A0A835CWA6_TETSI|nr:hypothetical protein HHK36_033254 [Tetracentron sinense]
MADTEIVSDENNNKDDVSIQIEDAGDMLASSIETKLEIMAPLSSERCNAGCIVTRSATELHQAGVQFKVGTSSRLLDVKFCEGVLEIPPLYIGDGTYTLFRNLITWEQCQDLRTPYIISYAFLMDCLINTPNDVSLLIDYGIIKNYLGLNAYCEIHCHEWQSSLRRDCFNTPPAIISFIATAVLLNEDRQSNVGRNQANANITKFKAIVTMMIDTASNAKRGAVVDVLPEKEEDGGYSSGGWKRSSRENSSKEHIL